jgi:hypothetical protein
MTNQSYVSAPKHRVARSRSSLVPWLVAAGMLGIVLCASATLAGQEARTTAKPGPGRVVATAGPTHGIVRPGKQLATVVHFPLGGVKPGKLSAVTPNGAR